MPANVNIQSMLIQGLSPDQSSKQIGPIQIYNANTVLEILDIAFASGTSITVSPPQFAVGCTITPPSQNLIALTLKGVSGDTGIPLSTNMGNLITFANPTSPASFVLTSAAAITTGSVVVNFF